MRAIHLLISFLCINAASIIAQAESPGDQVIWRDDSRTLTLRELKKFMFSDPLDLAMEEHVLYGQMVKDAGADLAPYYMDIILNANDAEQVRRGFIKYKYNVKDFTPYRKQLLEIFDERKDEYTVEQRSWRRCVLSEVGGDEHGPIFYSSLLHPDNPKKRFNTASLLAKIGGEQTLRDVEEMLPRLEELHQKDLEEVTGKENRQLLADDGLSPVEMDLIFAEERNHIEYNHKKLLAKIEKLREKVRLQKEGEASMVSQQPKPEKGGAAVPSSPTDSPETGGDTDPAGSGEEGKNLVIWASAILLVLVFSGYAIHRKRSRR